MVDSPLANPVKFKNTFIEVLDETALPFKEKYIKVKTLKDALGVLGSMRTRALGQVLLFFYSCVLFKDSFSIDDMVQEFKNKRPTFDFPLLGEILKKSLEKKGNLKEAAKSFINDFDRSLSQMAKILASCLPNKANILTICNVNGALIYLYQELKSQDREAFFYVCETRPYLQGTRLTFWELRKNNIPCKLICISQTVNLMKEGKINAVVTGADRATKKGDIINKIGTYSLARLSHHFNISFYPFAFYPKDIDVDSIKIEERDQREVFMFLKGSFDEIEAVYPSFDIVKSKFVTKQILVNS